jgi:hypothetical protein
VSRRARQRFAADLAASVSARDVEVTARVLTAALELAGRADAVRRRAVPPVPEES